MDKNLIKQAFKLGYQAGLEKLAFESPWGSAEIGSPADNGVNGYDGTSNPAIHAPRAHESAYIPQLQARFNQYGLSARHPANAPHIAMDHYVRGFSDDISQGELDDAREAQADTNALMFHPKGTPAYRRLKQNFIDSGAKNQKGYKRTGVIPERSVPDMRGIKGHTYTPEQLERIRKIQNIMVKAPTQTYGPSGPAGTTALA